MFPNRLRRPNHDGKRSEETLLRLKCKRLIGKMPARGMQESLKALQEIALYHEQDERYEEAMKGKRNAKRS